MDTVEYYKARIRGNVENIRNNSYPECRFRSASEYERMIRRLSMKMVDNAQSIEVQQWLAANEELMGYQALQVHRFYDGNVPTD